MKVSKKIYGSSTPFEIRIEKSVGRTFYELNERPESVLTYMDVCSSRR